MSPIIPTIKKTVDPFSGGGSRSTGLNPVDPNTLTAPARALQKVGDAISNVSTVAAGIAQRVEQHRKDEERILINTILATEEAEKTEETNGIKELSGSDFLTANEERIAKTPEELDLTDEKYGAYGKSVQKRGGLSEEGLQILANRRLVNGTSREVMMSNRAVKERKAVELNTLNTSVAGWSLKMQSEEIGFDDVDKNGITIIGFKSLTEDYVNSMRLPLEEKKIMLSKILHDGAVTFINDSLSDDDPITTKQVSEDVKAGKYDDELGKDAPAMKVKVGEIMSTTKVDVSVKSLTAQIVDPTDIQLGKDLRAEIDDMDLDDAEKKSAKKIYDTEWNRRQELWGEQGAEELNTAEQMEVDGVSIKERKQYVLNAPHIDGEARRKLIDHIESGTTAVSNEVIRADLLTRVSLAENSNDLEGMRKEINDARITGLTNAHANELITKLDAKEKGLNTESDKKDIEKKEGVRLIKEDFGDRWYETRDIDPDAVTDEERRRNSAEYIDAITKYNYLVDKEIKGMDAYDEVMKPKKEADAKSWLDSIGGVFKALTDPVGGALSLSGVLKEKTPAEEATGREEARKRTREDLEFTAKENNMTVDEVKKALGRKISGGSGSRGVKNKNPFNIRKTNIEWEGKTKGNDSSFETFNDPVMGIRAGVKNTLTHFSRGNNTVSKLISTHAPSSDNNPTKEFVDFVSSKMGVSATDVVDMKDPVNMRNYVLAVIEFENAGFKYNEKIVSEAIELGLGG